MYYTTFLLLFLQDAYSLNLDFESYFEILKLYQFLIIFPVAHITIFAMLTRMMSDYKVETINDGLNEFNVEFHGPKESIAFTLPFL